MIDAIVRLRFTFFMALAASIFVLVAVAGTTSMTLDADLLREVRAHLESRFGRPARVRLASSEGRVTLEVRYVPGAERARGDSAALEAEIMEQAFIRYPGAIDAVAVRAVAPEELFAGDSGADGAGRVSSVGELRRMLGAAGLIEYGDYHWPVRAPEVPWQYVLVHHSAADVGSARTMERWHRRGRGWDALGYQFVVGNGHGSGDGEIEPGERWTLQKIGAHAGVNKHAHSDAEKNKYNEQAVGICLVGNFASPARGGAGGRPTEAQLESLRFLTLYLCLKFGIAPENVLGHGDVAQTECPGDLFPKEAFVADIRRDLQRLRGIR